MKDLVVDTCVIVKWFLPEADSDRALALRESFRAGTVNLLAPDLLLTEFANVLWKQRSSLGLDEAEKTLAELRAWGLDLVSSAKLLDDALTLAYEHRRTVYDALYLTLARERECDLITADERLYNAVKDRLPWVKWLHNLPQP